MLQLRTLYTKILSLICASSAGVAVGKEGPMVQAGAIIGASFGLGGKGTGKLWSFLVRNDRVHSIWLQVFGSDKGHREFMLSGVAGGVGRSLFTPAAPASCAPPVP